MISRSVTEAFVNRPEEGRRERITSLEANVAGRNSPLIIRVALT